jgi:hypothetical protein
LAACAFIPPMNNGTNGLKAVISFSEKREHRLTVRLTDSDRERVLALCRFSEDTWDAPCLVGYKLLKIGLKVAEQKRLFDGIRRVV